MLHRYLKLYDTLIKELHVPEDKAKEIIVAIHSCAGVGKQLPATLQSMAPVMYEHPPKARRRPRQELLSDIGEIICHMLLTALITFAMGLLVLNT